MKSFYKISLICLTTALVIFGFYSCKTEINNPSPIEMQYFEDYTPPQYKWGFIGKSGEPVIDAIYDDLRDANSKIIAANLKGKWGFIDLNGNKVVDHKYKQAFDFSENRCFVQDFNNNWLLINEDGDSIKQLPYTSFKPFKDGLSIVGQANRYGVIDTSGSLIMNIIYPTLKYIKDGKFIAEKIKHGIINIKGNELLPFQFEKIYYSKTEVLRVKDDGLYAFYNIEKNMFSNDKYLKCYNFDGNFALVKTKSGYASVDKNFKKVHDFRYAYLEPIDGGFLKYKTSNNLYGIVDYKGNVMTKPEFELLNRYRSNMIVYSNNNLFGYLDNSGKELISPILPLVWDFKDGLARIITQNGIGFINNKGKMVIEDQFYEIKDFNNGIARYQSIR